MLTYVTDHLLNMPIPVEYIHPSNETVANKYDEMTALVATISAAQAEYVAMQSGDLDCVHVFNEDDRCDDYTSLEGPTLDRIVNARDALDSHLADWIGFAAIKSAAA